MLYLSSPIGLGHGRRDLAIAAELRRARPDLRIDWLAQPPLTAWLDDAASGSTRRRAFLASEAAHMDDGRRRARPARLRGDPADGRDPGRQLHGLQRASPARSTTTSWIGDEAWELDHFLHENPELKTDRLRLDDRLRGLAPDARGLRREAELTADYNAEMLAHVARHAAASATGRSSWATRRTSSPDRFGPGLPDIRDWTTAHYDFAGYVTGFDPAEIADRTALREQSASATSRCAWWPSAGSGVGGHLLRRAVERLPAAAGARPGLRMLVVTGPRIDPASLPARRASRCAAGVPDLHRLPRRRDVALVQGGLTTTMELTAAGRPFVYVPLRHHFEQNVHVRHRLQRYGAGRCVPWPQASPERLAEELAALVGTAPEVAPVDPGGAARAAALLADLL